MDIEQKFALLREFIGQYSKVAVAFSGGVDSSLLLWASVDVLGVENVVGFQGISRLQSSDVITAAEETFSNICGSLSTLHQVELYPLKLAEIAANTEMRCYFCKKNTYSVFIQKMHQMEYEVLFDGTNVDDFKEDRPGLRAIKELNVQTPLLSAGLKKNEIRKLAKINGLNNHDLASNSCLATRIPVHTKITQKLLTQVEEAESILMKFGFVGCRARVQKNKIVLEIQEKDFNKIAPNGVREKIIQQFAKLGFQTVHLNLSGRKG